MKTQTLEPPVQPSPSLQTPTVPARGGSLGFALVAACFFLSGLAALIYQTAWMRQFATVFGTSEPAVASVLAAYMSGLALGAFLAGRFLTRVRRPVLCYGLLELGVALGAVALPLGLALARSLHASIGGGLPEPPDAGGGSQVAFYLATTFCLVLVPTTFMGATLPLLARHAVRRASEIGSRVGTLYTINTVGAVLGTVLAAFFFLPSLGLQGTVWIGVVLNLLVFVVAVVLAKGAPAAEPDPAEEVAEPTGARAGSVILPLMAVSGAVAFTYEVLWTRLLGHVLGGSVYAFATMLASFLAGIAIGSALAARHAKTFAKSVNGFAGAQFALAVASLSLFTALRFLPDLQAWLGAGEDSGVGQNAVLSALFLLPSTIALGATFPFAVRILARSAEDAGRASARVFSWNTVGGTLGALAAGFAILPALEFEGTIRLCVVVNLLLALGAQFLLPKLPRRQLANLTVGAGLILVFFRPTAPLEVLRSSPFIELNGQGDVRWSEVGSSASVLVMQQGAEYQVRVNGLPQAVIAPKGALPWHGRHNRWLSVLPLAARPAAKSMCIIGLGGGVAAEALPSTVEEVDVFELSHEVVAANRFLSDLRNVDPLADPRVRVIENDARSGFERTTKRWDVIVSQPSHPWTAGASHLYTREFCALVSEHLNEDGVFLQWVSTRAFTMELLETYGATLLSEFEHVRLYQSSRMTPLFLASNSALDLEDALLDDPSFLEDEPAFHWLGVQTVEDLASRLTFDTEALRELCRGIEPNTDDSNRIALRPPSLGRRQASVDMESILAPQAVVDRFGSDEYAGRLDPLACVRSLCANEMPARARRLAERITDPVTRALALERVAQHEGNPDAAQRHFDAAREARPEDPNVAFGLVLRNIDDLDPDAPGMRVAIDSLPRAPRAVVDAWPAYGAQDWETLAGFEDDLASARPGEPWHLIAQQLRCFWRLEREGTDAEKVERAVQALEIVDRLIATGPSHTMLAIRAEAAAIAGRPHVLLETAELFALVLPSKLGVPEIRAAASQMAYDLKIAANDDSIDGARASELAMRIEGLCMFSPGG